MKLLPTFRRLVALMASFVLIPEAVLFLGLSTWKGIRFVESVKNPGAPHWYSFSSSLFLFTASVFCLFTCRDLWRKAGDVPREPSRGELRKDPENSTAAHRLTVIWLSASLTMCMFVLPLILVIMGAVLNQREEASWLIGIPVGMGVILFFLLLWLRRKNQRNQ